MTNTIDTENINRYIEHHPDDGCILYRCCGTCKFTDCFVSTATEGQETYNKERLLKEMKTYLRRRGFREEAITACFKEVI